MIMYALQLHNRAYLAVTQDQIRDNPEDLRPTGWRPYRWTRDAGQALPFGSYFGAALFAEAFKGVPFDIVPIERDLGMPA